MTTFTFHVDPGHGWIEVSTTQLADLGLYPHDFTRYSFRKGERCYLEEDCDATRFVDAYQRKHGAPPQFVEKYHARFNRDLPSIRS